MNKDIELQKIRGLKRETYTIFNVMLLVLGMFVLSFSWIITYIGTSYDPVTGYVKDQIFGGYLIPVGSAIGVILIIMAFAIRRKK
jgi:hypothetical protein